MTISQFTTYHNALHSACFCPPTTTWPKNAAARRFSKTTTIAELSKLHLLDLSTYPNHPHHYTAANVYHAASVSELR